MKRIVNLILVVNRVNAFITLSNRNQEKIRKAVLPFYKEYKSKEKIENEKVKKLVKIWEGKKLVYLGLKFGVSTLALRSNEHTYTDFLNEYTVGLKFMWFLINPKCWINFGLTFDFYYSSINYGVRGYIGYTSKTTDFAYGALNFNAGIIIKMARKPYEHNFFMGVSFVTSIKLNSEEMNLEYSGEWNDYTEKGPIRKVRFGYKIGAGYIYTPGKYGISFYLEIYGKIMQYGLDKVKTTNITQAYSSFGYKNLAANDGFIGFEIGFLFSL